VRPRRAGGRPGLLFDWALPLLAPPAGAPVPDLGTQFWAAAALGACLAACDMVTLARYANAVLAACQAVLEAEGTTVHLLGPTLAAVRQARPARHGLSAPPFRPPHQHGASRVPHAARGRALGPRRGRSARLPRGACVPHCQAARWAACRCRQAGRGQPRGLSGRRRGRRHGTRTRCARGWWTWWTFCSAGAWSPPFRPSSGAPSPCRAPPRIRARHPAEPSSRGRACYDAGSRVPRLARARPRARRARAGPRREGCPAARRASIGDTFQSFGDAWRGQAKFAGALAHRLVSDMEACAGAAPGPRRPGACQADGT